MVATLTGCGGGGGNSSTASHLAKRAFVSDNFDGTLHVIDAQKDVDSGFRVTTAGRPGPMVLSADKKHTLVFSATSNILQIVDNSTETVSASITLPQVSRSFVLLSDDTTAFAAVPTVSVVDALDFSSSMVTVTLGVSFANRVVLSNNGNKLLVFPDPGANQDTLTVIDTTAKTVSAPIAGFSRPVFGVFSSDDTKAYIMNCGPECGGAAADGSGDTSVSVLDMTASPPKISGSVIVSAGTVGLLNGSTLYVAGTPPGKDCANNPPGTSCGRLDVVNTSNLSVTTSGVVISDGFHDHMELASNNRLYIGAHICTNIAASGAVPARGCLSIFNTSANTAVVPAVFGDVTGIAPIAARDVVYVTQNGELQIFATANDALQATQIDIVGAAIDVKDIE